MSINQQTGDAKLTPATDPRVLAKLRPQLKKFGLDGLTPPVPLKPEDGIEKTVEFIDLSDQLTTKNLYEVFVADLGKPEDGTGVKYSLEHATNPDDGYQINMHIHRPENQGDKPLPAVVYTHGGGQMILHHYNGFHKLWTHDLARLGMVAINVGFRNGVEGKKNNPFPTGLNDCVAAVRWVNENRARLGISKIIIQGESGGGNLTLATTMKLLREGHGSIVDGVYAMIPYISGAYGRSDEWKRQAGLNSLVDLDGYFIQSSHQALFAYGYDPSGANTENPLAWPWWGKPSDFAGFPPTVIGVNEMDPLRDEGVMVSRTIAEAGVRVVARMNLGHMHGTDLFKSMVPEAYEATQADIKHFVSTL